MPKADVKTGESARILYWGAKGTGKTTSLECIAKTAGATDECTLSRIPTRLDPTTCYEELCIDFPATAGLRRRLTLIAIPSAPELGPVRMQLLDEIDAAVILLDTRRGREAANRASLNEFFANLAAYGRWRDALPIVVQYRQPDSGDHLAAEDLLAELALAPVATHATAEARVESFLEPLRSVVQALGPHPPSAEKSPAPGETDPWLGPPNPAPSAANDPGMGARLEAAILAEDEADEAPSTSIDAFFDAGPAAEGLSARTTTRLPLPKDLEIVSIGIAERAGKRGVRIPLMLGDSEGASVPLTLRIELETPPGERRDENRS